MKAHILHRPVAILSGLATLLVVVLVASPILAQDQREHKITVTVTANPQDKQDQKGIYKVKIIKDDNGKKVVIDTTISIKGPMDKEKFDELMENLEGEMEDLQSQMKDLEFSFGSFNDSVMKDSSGHYKAYTFRFHGNPSCKRIRIHENPGEFNYNFEIPDFPELLSIIERGWNHGWEGHHPGTEIMTLPKRGESLSDILGDIPMSRVKAYKIIDKKGGKRIVIDLKDGPMFDSGDRMIYIHDTARPPRPPRGVNHDKDIKVIINSGDEKNQNDAGQQNTPPPPPDSEPKKSQPDSPKI
jgi:hypothetical protein